MKAEYAPRIDLKNRTRLETVIPLQTPFVIFVDPSDACNFKCRFCPTSDRKLMKEVGRSLKVMDFVLFKKIADDICEFPEKIKVLRMYKDGEPLINKRFADMIKYAKDIDCAERIDTTTNASLLTNEIARDIIDAGLDRINISIEGVNNEQYKSFSDVELEYDRIVDYVKFFFENRKQCEVLVKINGDILTEDDKQQFFDTFGNYADKIHIEHIMACWPEFKLKGVEVNQEYGIYGQKIKEVIACPYVFYSFSINSDGSASICFLDWSRKLIIGDAKTQKVKDIWNGEELRKYQKMFLEGERKNHPICGNCGQMSHGQPDDIDPFAEMLLGRLRNK